jgi:sporulation protein YlmC with PRC-barrel domain
MTSDPETIESALPDTISDYIDLEVYTVTGRYVGCVEDTKLDFGNGFIDGLAITNVNRDLQPVIDQEPAAKGLIIPYRWLMSVSDVIVVSDVFNLISNDPIETDSESNTKPEISN